MKDHTPELLESFVSREEIFHGAIVHLVRDTVTLPNGKPATRETILHNGAVAIVPLFEDGTVLMDLRDPRGQAGRARRGPPRGRPA